MPSGLALGRAYFEACGLPMLQSQFPSLLPRLAAGLVGHGSECFGFDDDISADHDFEPTFCLFLSDEDESAFSFALERACAKLPKEFGGVRLREGSAGFRRERVQTVSRFYERYTGAPKGPETPLQWMVVPSYALAEVTNGEVFFDGAGEFSRIRQHLLSGMPEDVRRKRLAAALALAAQSGQYNYRRCLAHGEEGAAMLALSEFVRQGCEAVFLLNRAHAPYYKWTLRALRALPLLSDLATAFEFLLTEENDEKGQALKGEIIEDISRAIAAETSAQFSIPRGEDCYLERFAVLLQRQIREPSLLPLHLMEGS